MRAGAGIRVYQELDNYFMSNIQTPRFTARNESFACLNCGKQVEKTKRSYRNHCPFCLASLHVDIFPGDRLEKCHGIMDALALEQKKSKWVIIHKCQLCGKEQKNKTAEDDSQEALVLVAKKSAQ